MTIPTGWWFGTSILFSHILGISSSQLTFIFFRGVAQPPTRQLRLSCSCPDVYPTQCMNPSHTRWSTGNGWRLKRDQPSGIADGGSSKWRKLSCGLRSCPESVDVHHCTLHIIVSLMTSATRSWFGMIWTFADLLLLQLWGAKEQEETSQDRTVFVLYPPVNLVASNWCSDVLGHIERMVPDGASILYGYMSQLILAYS